MSHAAIALNKRLGEVLAFIKSQQDARPSVHVKTNSEKTGYQSKTGRKPPGKRPAGRQADGQAAGLVTPDPRSQHDQADTSALHARGHFTRLQHEPGRNSGYD